MKKLFIFAAVFAAITMTSCKKSAADYAKEGDDLMEQIGKLMEEGKVEEAEKVSKKLETLGKEVQEKAESDPEFAKELEQVYQKQYEESMKNKE